MAWRLIPGSELQKRTRELRAEWPVQGSPSTIHNNLAPNGLTNQAPSKEMHEVWLIPTCWFQRQLMTSTLQGGSSPIIRGEGEYPENDRKDQSWRSLAK